MKGKRMCWRARYKGWSVPVRLLCVVTVLWTALLLLSPAPPPPAAPPVAVHTLPLELWRHRADFPEHYGEPTCGRAPMPATVLLARPPWQRVSTGRGNVYVYSAHWDDRYEHRLVRVMMYADILPVPGLFCQLWYQASREPVVEPANISYAWSQGKEGPFDGLSEPYIVTCAVAAGAAPLAVSLADTACGAASTALAVQGREPRGDGVRGDGAGVRGVAVCARWPTQGMRHSRFVEWTVLLRHFGVERIYIYLTTSSEWSPEAELAAADELVQRVVWREAPAGAARASLPPDGRARAHRKLALLPLNDCLYRALRHYRWVTILDMDETILPLQFDTLEAVIAAAMKEGTPADVLLLESRWFPSFAQRDLPDGVQAATMPFLSYTWRVPAPQSQDRYRALYSTETVVSLVPLAALRCEDGAGARGCWVRRVPAEAAQARWVGGSCVAQPGETCAGLQRSALHDPRAAHRWAVLADTVRDRVQRIESRQDEVMNRHLDGE